MGASFEYDEVGNTFYYVLISFYALILIPATYFFFPSGDKGESSDLYKVFLRFIFFRNRQSRWNRMPVWRLRHQENQQG